MKKQVCVRTYPNNFTSTTESLDELLNSGYTVVMCNTFEANRDQKGNEYILEKEDDPSELQQYEKGYNTGYDDSRKTAKAEAYKEFAERLDNETFGVYYASSLYHVVDIDDVKEILKELVGDI